MSFTLPVVDLSTAVVNTTGTVSWAAVAPQAAYAASGTTPHLALFNESGCGLTLQLSTGEQLFLPAGGWRTIDLNPACTSFSYSVAYTMNGALVNSLIVVWFGPEENPPPPTILGNSPIGGSVTSTAADTALKLIGLAGATSGIVTTERLIVPFFPSTQLETLSPVTGVGTNAGIIGVSNPAAGPVDDIAWYNGQVVIGATGSTQGAGGGIITRYGGENLVGRGVPVMRALMENVNVTDTLTHSISLTAPNDGAQHTYRVGGYVITNNGTTPSVLSVQILFTDFTGSRTDTLMGYFATGTIFPNGVNTVANGHYQFPAVTPTINPNTTITARYIASNTPNDRVTLYIERLT